MKSKKALLLSTMTLISLLVTGCGNVDTQNSDAASSNNASEGFSFDYTAEDINYFTKADELIFSNNKINYYKAYDGFTAVALANIGKYYGPVLVGEDPAQVCFKQDHDTKVTRMGGSVVVNGKTYYYSKADYFVRGSFSNNEKLPMYFSEYTTLEEVAKDLVNKATFEAVPESAKSCYKYVEDNDGKLIITAVPYFEEQEVIEVPAYINGKEVKEIANEGFRGFTELKEVILPDTLVSIGERAFYECSNLNRVYIPASVNKCGEAAFRSCASDLYVFIESEEVPNGFYVNNYGDDWYTGIKKYVLSSKGYIEEDSILYSVDDEDNLTLTSYEANKDGEVNLPTDGKIDNYIVTSLGGAFKGDKTLTNVNIPSTVTAIGENEFDGCINLEYVPDMEDTDIKTIGSYAFRSTNLKEFRISRSVESVGEKVFYDSAIETIVFEGTKDEWMKLTTPTRSLEPNSQTVFDASWDMGSNVNMIVCSDGNLYLDR